MSFNMLAKSSISQVKKVNRVRSGDKLHTPPGGMNIRSPLNFGWMSCQEIRIIIIVILIKLPIKTKVILVITLLVINRLVC